MILKIKSNNDKLLDLLHKNPNTDFGLYAKTLRNGIVLGNAVDKNYYEVVFRDTKYSYLPEDINQIDYQSYCTPLAVLHIFNELFSHILKSKDEYMSGRIEWLNATRAEIDNEECIIEIPSFYIDSSWFRNDRFLLQKYFEGIAVERQSKRVFKLTITAKSVFEAFNLLALVSLMAHITNDYGVFMFLDDSLLQKYGRILTNLDNVPYFVFYLFIMKAIKSERQFAELKSPFEDYLGKYGLDANLVKQGTYLQRIYFIVDKLETDIPVLDIGCGELTYYKRMMTKGLTALYYAIDKDEKFERIAENIGRRYDANNLVFGTSLEDFQSDECVNILLTEVIEHNPLDEAVELIKKALSYNFNKLIITTPNAEFNQFYSMERDKRHDDHHFEPTREEFENLISSCIEGMSCNVEYTGLGDSLNGIQPTQACVITKGV